MPNESCRLRGESLRTRKVNDRFRQSLTFALERRTTVPSLKRPSPGRFCNECCGRVRTAIRSLRYVDHPGLGVLAEGRASQPLWSH